MLRLAISRNSFHYKYYLILRKMWSFADDEYRPNASSSSLCIYSQFLFWFSILTVLVSPMMFVGWLVLKTGRCLYKVCSWTPVGRKLLDVLDGLGLGDKIDKLSAKMVENPATTLLGVFTGFCMYAIATLLIGGMVLGGIVYIKTLMMTIAAFFMCLGLALFYIFFGMGWVLAHIFFAIKIACLVVVYFIIGYAIVIGYVLALIAASSLVSFVCIKIAMSSEKLRKFLGFKLNGYHKARGDLAQRRKDFADLLEQEKAKLKQEKETIKQKKVDGEIPYTFWEKIGNGLFNAMVAIVGWLGEFFIARTKNVQGGTYKVVTGFGVVWETLKALKQGVCPLIEFVDEDEDDTEEATE